MGMFARLIPAFGPSPHLQWDKPMTASSQLQDQWESLGDGKIKLKVI
jgi:hypothetical protein